MPASVLVSVSVSSSNSANATFVVTSVGIGRASHHGPLSGLSVSYDHDLFQCVVIFFQGDVIVVAGDQFGGEIPVADIIDDERSPSRVRKGEFSVHVVTVSDVNPVGLHRCPGNGLPRRVAHGAVTTCVRLAFVASGFRNGCPSRDRGAYSRPAVPRARYAQHSFQFPEQRAAAVVGRLLYERIHPQVVDAALPQRRSGRTARVVSLKDESAEFPSGSLSISVVVP